MNPDEIERRLVEVRRAYRLIHAYQRRILDMLDESDRWMHRTLHVEFARWRPSLWNRPAEQTTPFFRDRWAWDLLPGLHFWVAWNGSRGGVSRQVVFTVSGDQWNPSVGREPEAADLAPPEEATSLLYVRCDVVGAREVSWDQAWKALEAQKDWRTKRVSYALGAARCTSEVMAQMSLAALDGPEALHTKVLEPIARWFGDHAPGTLLDGS